MNIESLRIMSSLIRERIDDIVPQICEGRYEDYPSYREAVGTYKALRESLSAIQETIEKLKEDEE